MLKLTEIARNCFYFHGAINVGYVRSENEGLLIDAGLEASTMKKILRQLDEQQMPVTHLILTHCHADHYGGAAYLQSNRNVIVYSTKLEASIAENPILEPIYLFHGAYPIREMRNKFLEGTAAKVNYYLEEGDQHFGEFSVQIIPLPGHSYEQVGVLINGILYAGDAYFGKDALEKHKIPYIVDAEETIHSLEKISKLECEGAIPGHGVFEKDFHGSIWMNLQKHEQITSNLRTILTDSHGKIEFQQAMSALCQLHDVHITSLPSWALYRTAVTAYMTRLVKTGEARFTIENNALWLVKEE